VWVVRRYHRDLGFKVRLARVRLRNTEVETGVEGERWKMTLEIKILPKFFLAHGWTNTQGKLEKGGILEVRRLFALLTVAIILMALMVPTTVQASSFEPTFVTILHTNDFHGNLLGFKPTLPGNIAGGSARIATLVNDIRDSAPGIVLLLDAGDAIHGTIISNFFDGKPVIDVMNAMGYDAMEIGNHEFNYGQAVLAERASQAEFPLLAANIRVTATGETPPFCQPYVIKEVMGKRIAIFGLITPDTPVVTHPKNVIGLTFLDPIETATKLVPKLQPQADLIIALTHIGYDMDRLLGEEVGGINVIVGGHSHTMISVPERLGNEGGNAIIVQAWEQGKVLGRLDLEMRGKAIVRYSGGLINVTADVPEDPDVKAIIEPYAAELSAAMSEVVGYTTVPLEGTRSLIRTRETNLGNLVADMMRWAAGPDVQIALENGGGIRWHRLFPAGPITRGDVYNLLPFLNTLVMMDLTGAQIRQALENGVSKYPTADGRFPQISGLTFTYDPTKPAGSRIVDVWVGGAPLDETAVYRVATNDFLAAGGDGYAVLTQGTNYVDTGVYLMDYMVDYLGEFSPISPAVEGRIVVVSP